MISWTREEPKHFQYCLWREERLPCDLVCETNTLSRQRLGDIGADHRTFPSRSSQIRAQIEQHVRPLAVSTILDSVTEGNNAELLIWLEDDYPVPHEVQISHQSPCKIRVRHTARRHWVTPDASTHAISHGE